MADERDYGKFWDAYSYAVVDLEGTGSQDKEREQIVSIAIVPIVQGKVRIDEAFYSLVKPDYPIKRRPWLKHQITNDRVKDAPRFQELEQDVVTRLRQTVFVAHNARIDWGLLRRFIPGLDVVAVLDTLKLSRKLHQDLKHHRLTDLLHYYQLDEIAKELTGAEEHHALYDAVGTAFLFLRMLEKLSSTKLKLSELIRLCGLETDDVLQTLLF